MMAEDVAEDERGLCAGVGIPPAAKQASAVHPMMFIHEILLCYRSRGGTDHRPRIPVIFLEDSNLENVSRTVKSGGAGEWITLRQYGRAFVVKPPSG